MTLKGYTKGERVLRFEAIVHNTRELGCGRVIAKLPTIVARLKAIVDRALRTLQWMDRAFVADATLDQSPVRRAWVESTSDDRGCARCWLPSFEKPGHARRYQVLDQGLRTITALVVLREHVLKPLLAAAAHPSAGDPVRRRLGRKPKHWSPIDEHYQTLRSTMRAVLDHLHLAAA